MEYGTQLGLECERVIHQAQAHLRGCLREGDILRAGYRYHPAGDVSRTCASYLDPKPC